MPPLCHDATARTSGFGNEHAERGARRRHILWLAVGYPIRLWNAEFGFDSGRPVARGRWKPVLRASGAETIHALLRNLTAGPDLWLVPAESPTPVHLALTAESTQQVDDFHRAALAAGGADNGAPGERPHYHPGYYGAFVLDPDGHNLEAVFHGTGK